MSGHVSLGLPPSSRQRSQMDEVHDTSTFQEQHGIDIRLADPRSEVQMGRRHAGMPCARRADDPALRNDVPLVDANGREP